MYIAAALLFGAVMGALAVITWAMLGKRTVI
jgi:hypothetical protein